MRILVVYYSRTGATKFVAQAIASELSADIEEIVDQKKREGKIGWMKAGRDAMQEKQTEIATVKTLAYYDLIILGTPVWAWRPTPAIRTYVAKNGDLAGKKVALFFTMDGNPKEAIQRTKALMPRSVFLGSDLLLTKPLGNKEESEKKIEEWCNTLKTAETVNSR